jgi:hypothetical protein
MRPDITARDREARIELPEAMRSFRVTLGEGSDAFKGYSIQLQHSFAEHHDRLLNISEEALSKQQERVTADAKASGEALHLATEKAVGATLKTVEAMLDAAMERSEKATVESARNAEMALQRMAGDEIARQLR